jgi:hypothetical protein
MRKSPSHESTHREEAKERSQSVRPLGLFLDLQRTDLGESRLVGQEHWSIAALWNFDDDRFMLALGQKVLLHFLP